MSTPRCPLLQPRCYLCRLPARLPAHRHFCAGTLNSPHSCPSCLPVPPNCGQLGGKCCPPELRGSGSGGSSGSSSGTSQAAGAATNKGGPPPAAAAGKAFCHAADVLCTAPRSSINESGKRLPAPVGCLRQQGTAPTTIEAAPPGPFSSFACQALIASHPQPNRLPCCPLPAACRVRQAAEQRLLRRPWHGLLPQVPARLPPWHPRSGVADPDTHKQRHRVLACSNRVLPACPVIARPTTRSGPLLLCPAASMGSQ